MVRYTLFLLLSLILSYSAYAVQDSVMVVSAHKQSRKKNPIKNARLYLSNTKNHKTVWIFGAGKLPRKVKRIKSKNNNILMNRMEIKRTMEISLDSTRKLLKDTALAFQTRIPKDAFFAKEKTKFFKGQGSNIYFKNQWIRIAHSPTPGNLVPDVLKIYKPLLINTKYTVSKLPASDIERLYPIHIGRCVSRDLDFLQIRKLLGYGMLRIKCDSVRRPLRRIERRTFDLYFPTNETKPGELGVEAITNFLKVNQLEILGIEIEGGYSLEGSTQRNHELMKARAKTLQQIFKKHYNKTLRKDTVFFHGPSIQFKKQIENTEYSWLAEMTDENLQDTINASPLLRRNLEPYLIQQRKAFLRIAMSKPIGKDEFATATIKHLGELAKRYLSKPETSLLYEGELAGNIMNIINAYRAGEFSAIEVDSVFYLADEWGLSHVLAGCLLIREYEILKTQGDSSKFTAWKKRFIELDEAHLLLMANLACVYFLQQEKTRPFWTKFHRILNDLQVHSMEFMMENLFPSSYFCQIGFPNEERFWSLAINSYAHLYFKERQGEEIWCIGENAPEFFSLYNSSSKHLQDRQQQVGDISPAYIKIGERYYKKPTFSEENFSPWYLITKKYLMAIQKRQSSPVYLANAADLPFHLYIFLNFTITSWIPEENYFFDSDIQLLEITDLISMMKKYKGKVCTQDVDQLFLDYYLKTLRHLQVYGSPGNPKHTRAANLAFKELVRYFRQYSVKISPEYGLALAKQLIQFESVPSNISGAYSAYHIYSQISKFRILSDAENTLFISLVKLYDPKLKKQYGKVMSKELSAALKKR